MKKEYRKIEIDSDAAAYIASSGTDYRLRTSCMGPVLVPIKYSAMKDSDIPVKVGNHTVFVSEFQYKSGLRIIRKSFLERESCRF